MRRQAGRGKLLDLRRPPADRRRRVIALPRIRATNGGQRQLLERLARSVADLAHMRMFVAMIVEADADPTVRRVMRRATERIEAALAAALGGDNAAERARLVLAAIWGLGLYQFLMRPASTASPMRAYLLWLVGGLQRTEATGGAPIRSRMTDTR